MKNKAKNGDSVLMTACLGSNFAVIERLLKVGVMLEETNAKGKRAIEICLQLKAMESIMILLIDTGANFEFKDPENDGVTVLQSSVTQFELLDVSFKLIDQGANIHSKSNSGNSILSTAYRHGNLEVVKCLVF